VNINAEDFELGIDDNISCGLIVNELVSNAIKYAFPDDKMGRINVSFSKLDDETYRLIIQDNGVGISEKIDFASTESFGLHLTKILAKQIEGEAKMERAYSTKINVEFKGYHYEKTKYSHR